MWSRVVSSPTIVGSSSASRTFGILVTLLRGFRRPLGGLGAGMRSRWLQGGIEHFVHGLDEDEFHTVLDLIGNIVQVETIALGEHDRPKPIAIARQHLLLYAADGQHLPAQCDLTRHAEMWLALATRYQRHEGRGHSDARGRSVLG